MSVRPLPERRLRKRDGLEKVYFGACVTVTGEACVVIVKDQVVIQLVRCTSAMSIYLCMWQ